MSPTGKSTNDGRTLSYGSFVGTLKKSHQLPDGVGEKARLKFIRSIKVAT